MDDRLPETSDLAAARLVREEILLRQAEASLDRGEFVTLEAVTAWAESLGTDHELPLPPPERAPKTQQR